MSGTGPDRRDAKATAAVACPVCHAPAGTPCYYAARPPSSVRQGRMFTHTERRKLWTETKPK